jgi:hypothetical protein
MNEQTNIRSEGGTSVVTFVTTMIVLCWLGAWLDMDRAKTEAIAQATRSSQNLAITLKEYSERTIDNLDHVLSRARDEYLAPRTNSNPHFSLQNQFAEGIAKLRPLHNRVNSWIM